MFKPVVGNEEGFGAGSVPSFSCRVRQMIYLWGSASLNADANFASPPMLHVRNGRHGDAVAIGTTTAAGGNAKVATLQPGECVSLEIQGLNGITASCTTEATVYCIFR